MANQKKLWVLFPFLCIRDSWAVYVPWRGGGFYSNDFIGITLIFFVVVIFAFIINVYFNKDEKKTQNKIKSNQSDCTIERYKETTKISLLNYITLLSISLFLAIGVISLIAADGVLLSDTLAQGFAPAVIGYYITGISTGQRERSWKSIIILIATITASPLVAKGLNGTELFGGEITLNHAVLTFFVSSLFSTLFRYLAIQTNKSGARKRVMLTTMMSLLLLFFSIGHNLKNREADESESVTVWSSNEFSGKQDESAQKNTEEKRGLQSKESGSSYNEILGAIVLVNEFNDNRVSFQEYVIANIGEVTVGQHENITDSIALPIIEVFCHDQIAWEELMEKENVDSVRMRFYDKDKHMVLVSAFLNRDGLRITQGIYGIPVVDINLSDCTAN